MRAALCRIEFRTDLSDIGSVLPGAGSAIIGPSVPQVHGRSGGDAAKAAAAHANFSPAARLQAAEERAGFVYCRVSTDAQEREGTSLETQKAACREYAASRSWTVLEVCRDTASGFRLERTGLDRCVTNRAQPIPTLGDQLIANCTRLVGAQAGARRGECVAHALCRLCGGWPVQRQSCESRGPSKTGR